MTFLDLRDGESFEDFAKRSLKEFAENDHLGKAAAARDKAKAAEALSNHDVAWGFYHEQKAQYIEHARKNRFTAAQTLALDASVSENLANILRLEGKHLDALVHIVYWVSTTHIPTKSQSKKLIAYFNHCKFRDVDEPTLLSAVEALRVSPDFAAAKDKVAAWNRGA